MRLLLFLVIFSLIKSARNHFLYLKFKKYNACAESKVGISTQDGPMGYLSLISYLREGTSLLDFMRERYLNRCREQTICYSRIYHERCWHRCRERP